jgi:hypothetical protein
VETWFVIKYAFYIYYFYSKNVQFVTQTCSKLVAMPMLFACFNKLLLGYVRFQLVEKLSTACWQLVTRLLTQRTCCKLFKEVFFPSAFKQLVNKLWVTIL